jgi:hypothetical protein
MYTKPNPGDLIDAVMVSLNQDILPELQSQKAQVTCVMMGQILQAVRTAIPVFQQIMAQEHNEMTAVLRDVGAIVGESAGTAADRIRARSQGLGLREDIPVPMAYEDLAAAYKELSEGLVETLDDLDALIRGGSTAADEALLRLREHLGPRTMREVGTYVAGVGMAGRG